MRIVTHTKLVTRNTTIAKYSSGLGFVALIGALFLNIYAISQPLADQSRLIAYVFAAFIAGYTLTTVGGALNNRWGRRPDQGLADGLRGLDDRYSLYNFRLGAAHVLVGPGGVFVLLPKYQPGAITYEGGKWKNPGSNRGLLSFFARDVLGNPTAEAAYEVEQLNKFLKKHLPEVEVAPQPVVVFMNSRAVVSAKDAPVAALHIKQLKDHIRKAPKGATLPPSALSAVEEKLGFAPQTESAEA
jgi:hypothetical protein